MKRNAVTGALVAALTVSGCTTHLEVGPAGQTAETRQGIAYFLPFTQFETEISWVLTACPTDTNIPEITIKTAVKPVTGPDPSALYVIDYRSLDAWTKTSSVKVDFYDSGAIKAINASADDRTAEIMTSVIQSVGKIVKFASTGGAAMEPQCDAAAAQALTDIKKTKGELGTETDKLDRLAEQLAAATAAYVVAGGDRAEALKAMNGLIAQVTAQQITVDAKKRALASLMKKVTYTADAVRFPSSSSVAESASAALLPLEKLKDWLANESDLGDTKLKELQGENGVWLMLATEVPISHNEREFSANDEGKQTRAAQRAGIRYRVGVPGTLQMCRVEKCSVVASGNSDSGEVIDQHRVTILQSGTTFFLPFKSEPFTNAALTATFAESGVMTSAGYEQKKAAGEAGAKVLAELAGQMTDIGTAIRENRPSEVEKLQEKTALAKAQKELADAEKALIESPNSAAADAASALAADTALKKAELANIEAEIALRKAKAERDAP